MARVIYEPSIRPESPEYPLDPVIPAYYYYNFIVIDSNRDPIVGATAKATIVGYNDIQLTSDIEGKVICQLPNKEINCPSSITFNVSCIGYEDGNITINKTSINDRYKTCQLTEDSQSVTKYFYKIIVQDENGNEISDPTISTYKSDGTSISSIYWLSMKDSNEFTTFSDESSLIVSVSKVGYTTVNNIRLVGSQNINPTPANIILESNVLVGNYIIKVVDENNEPIKDAKIKLYGNFQYDLPYSIEKYFYDDPKSYNDILEKVQIILNENGSLVESGVVDNIAFIEPDNNLKDDLGFDSYDIVSIISSVNDEFGTNINYIPETVDDIVKGIQNEIGQNDEIYVTIYSTNDLGMIIIPAQRNKTLYAQCIYVPEKETYNRNTLSEKKGAVRVTRLPQGNLVGLTLTIDLNIQNQYYYNIYIIDEYTGSPIKDITVNYTNGDDNGTITGKNGYINLNTINDELQISINDARYYTYSQIIRGDEDSSQKYYISLTPKNTIRVVKDDDSDSDSSGVGDLTIIVFDYDEKGKKNIYEYKTTYNNGYIDSLDPSYYSGNEKRIFVQVQGYSKTKTQLVVGHITIVLPEQTDTEEADNKDVYHEFNQLSISNIKKNILSGNTNPSTTVIYYNVTSDGIKTENSNDFKINVVDPDSIYTYDVFTSVPIMIDNNEKSVLGSVDITLKPDVNDLKLKVINRYSGYYNPIFKDILFYNDYIVDNGSEEPEDLYVYSNTSFDSEYKDAYGSFGIINNMWFHKVNDNKNVEFIKSLTPCYPLIDQYALDYKDYNIFESNWDINHYIRQIDLNQSEECKNISSMKDGLCMFGSKYLNVPEVIEISGLTLGDDSTWDGEWNDDWIVSPDACPGEIMIKEVGNNANFYIFLRKRILRYFRDKLRTEFEKYVNPLSSFGNPDTLDDDIDEYVSKNILKLYKLDKIRIFVRRIKKGIHDSKINNDYTKYLEYITNPKTGVLEPITKDNLGYFKSHGFIEVNNVTMSKVNTDDFDRKLVYNLRTGMQECFAFSFIIRKI